MGRPLHDRDESGAPPEPTVPDPGATPEQTGDVAGATPPEAAPPQPDDAVEPELADTSGRPPLVEVAEQSAADIRNRVVNSDDLTPKETS